MKKHLMLMMAAMLSFFISCDEDDITEVSQHPYVAFADINYPTVPEGEQITITVTTDAPVSQPITVDYQFTGNTSGIEVLSGSQITIPAGQTEGYLIIQGIDDTTAEENDDIVIELVGNNQGYNLGFLTDRSYKKTITRINDDCDRIPNGTYTTSNTGTYDGAYSVEVTLMEVLSDDTFKYSISDITGGTYVEAYGAADNPGVFVQTRCGISVDPDENPDVVYGGDQFSGTGGIITVGSESFSISWSNTYGDNGETVFVKE